MCRDMTLKLKEEMATEKVDLVTQFEHQKIILLNEIEDWKRKMQTLSEQREKDLSLLKNEKLELESTALEAKAKYHKLHEEIEVERQRVQEYMTVLKGEAMLSSRIVIANVI